MKILSILLLSVIVSALASAQTGNVIFIHPDGTGLGHWNAARHLAVGPDGWLNWDKMDRLAAYRPHQKGWLSSTSHAGGTVHAYGRKVHPDSYGFDRDQPIKALSGSDLSIMKEAMAAGIRCGIVNSGHIGEPGTGVFLASVMDRADVSSIAVQIVNSGADVVFTGGEVWMLPKGIKGVHGKEGLREDGRDLTEEARSLGYTVIFTRDELLNLPADTRKVLGIFAAINTYNDKNEAALQEAGLPLYDPAAPTFADMTAAALKVLSNDAEKTFFLMAEEEGTDNFSNYMNAAGMLEAVRRADAGIGEALTFMETNPQRPTLLLVGSDSDAGHPSVWTAPRAEAGKPLRATTKSGAAIDGVSGGESMPFVTPPDAMGTTHEFGIAWGYGDDFPGSVVTKAHGFRSEKLKSTVDNTGIYRLIYDVLFGKAL
jgi:alkaline phosphatase